MHRFLLVGRPASPPADAGDRASDDTGLMFDQAVDANAVLITTGTTNNVLLISIGSDGTMPQNPLASGMLEVKTPGRGGVTRLEWAGDDAYMVQAEVNPAGGAWAELPGAPGQACIPAPGPG